MMSNRPYWLTARSTIALMSGSLVTYGAVNVLSLAANPQVSVAKRQSVDYPRK
jgi:hypothetical protein